MMDHTVTILVVDDDKVDTMAVRRSFRELKIANPVVEARNGIEALEHLRGENGHEKVPSPCLVLLDLNMPRMGGIEFLERAARRSVAAPHPGVRDDHLGGGGGPHAGLRPERRRLRAEAPSGAELPGVDQHAAASTGG